MPENNFWEWFWRCRAGKREGLAANCQARVVITAGSFHPITSAEAVATLANLGMMFLLFDLGPHFPLPQVRDGHRKDCLGRHQPARSTDWMYFSGYPPLQR